MWPTFEVPFSVVRMHAQNILPYITMFPFLLVLPYISGVQNRGVLIYDIYNTSPIERQIIYA